MNSEPNSNARSDSSSRDLLSVASMGVNWAPLRAKLGDELCEQLMFMASYPASGQVVHTYKHRDTRRYFNLDETGQCYAYKWAGYSAITDEDAFAHVFG